MKGLLVTFEGPDGVGKTTQAKKLFELLKERNYDVILFREPGGTFESEWIRDILLDPSYKNEMLPETEVFLFGASRAQLVETMVLPTLKEGKVVLCDRFSDSTVAYQGYGRKLNPSLVRLVNEFATGGLKPDLTFFFDVDVEVGLRRRDSSGKSDRLDQEELEFHQRVREGYLKMVEEEPERWVRIDASRTAEEVFADVRDIAFQRLKEAGIEPKREIKPDNVEGSRRGSERR